MSEIVDALTQFRAEKFKEVENLRKRLSKAAEGSKAVRLSPDAAWALHSLLERAYSVRDNFTSGDHREGDAATFILTGDWPRPVPAPADEASRAAVDTPDTKEQ